MCDAVDDLICRSVPADHCKADIIIRLRADLNSKTCGMPLMLRDIMPVMDSSLHKFSLYLFPDLRAPAASGLLIHNKIKHLFLPP